MGLMFPKPKPRALEKADRTRARVSLDEAESRFPKGMTRKRLKGKRDRHEAAVIKVVRAACVARDGYCRLLSDGFSRDDYYQMRPPATDWQWCSGPSEWAHFGAYRRARTRKQTPERRHTTAGSLMLCARHHDAYDEFDLQIEALTEAGCDGPLRARVC